ncbi:hypothetical protein FGB62_25g245 [Gracilaria domingensis]|nr:hypothetical protein FGB62_25g245 [Gracilaria domingensis]
MVDESVMSMVEDSIAVYTENCVRPADIRQLCDGCRPVILRQVDMEDVRPTLRVNFRSGPTSNAAVYTSDRGFDHGPTPNSIKATIRYVRDLLWDKKKKTLVVFLADAQAFYNKYCGLSNEQNHRIADIRTLKKYICPSLAATDILPRVASRKIGTVFYCVQSFGLVAADAKACRSEEVTLLLGDQFQMWQELSGVFMRFQGLIRALSWSLSFFIKLVPKKLWHCEMIANDPRWLLRRAKSHARILGEAYYQQWSFDPTEVRDDIERPCHRVNWRYQYEQCKELRPQFFATRTGEPGDR